MFLAFALLLLLFSNAAAYPSIFGDRNLRVDEDKVKQQALQDMLFPPLFENLTSISRRTADAPVCVQCNSLHYCEVLEGKRVQEVYLPLNEELMGTCGVIEELGERMSERIFGVGKTFRDTPQCRDIVLQYLCLFWGSNSDMYTNTCPDVVVGEEQELSAKPPCRSFCVQIAEVCANDYSFLGLCSNIACEQGSGVDAVESGTEKDCTPDPTITVRNATTGSTAAVPVTDTGLGCKIPYDANPYANNSANRNNGHTAFLMPLIILVSSIMVLYNA